MCSLLPFLLSTIPHDLVRQHLLLLSPLSIQDENQRQLIWHRLGKNSFEQPGHPPPEFDPSEAFLTFIHYECKQIYF